MSQLSTCLTPQPDSLHILHILTKSLDLTGISTSNQKSQWKRDDWSQLDQGVAQKDDRNEWEEKSERKRQVTNVIPDPIENLKLTVLYEKLGKFHFSVEACIHGCDIFERHDQKEEHVGENDGESEGCDGALKDDNNYEENSEQKFDMVWKEGYISKEEIRRVHVIQDDWD